MLGDFDARTGAEHVSEVCALLLSPQRYVAEALMDFCVASGRHDALQQSIDAPDLAGLSLPPLRVDSPQLGVLGASRLNNTAHNQEGGFRKLGYSEHNPPLPGVASPGDLMYLDFVDRAGVYTCITVSTRGVFANSSTADVFSEKARGEVHMSLLECLAALSEDFTAELRPVIDITDGMALKGAALADFSGEPEQEWLRAVETPTTRTRSLLNTRARLASATQSKVAYRDWVEELHNCRALPTADTLQQVHRVRVLRRTQSDFVAAAESLARAVVSGALLPLNPSDSRAEACFVHNNLFATFALDGPDWSLPRGDTAPTTCGAVAADVRNLAQLLSAELPGVNVINTAAVDIAGVRRKSRASRRVTAEDT